MSTASRAVGALESYLDELFNKIEELGSEIDDLKDRIEKLEKERDAGPCKPGDYSAE